MPIPHADYQELHQGSAYVELYKIDLTEIGGTTYYVTNWSKPDGGNIVFGAQTYVALPIKGEGFAQELGGVQSKPTLSVSDVGKVFFASLNTLGDCIGGKVTRIETFERYLDGMPDADPSKFKSSTYIIHQKTEFIPGKHIKWALSSISDRLGFFLPRRQFLGDKGFPGLSLYRQ
jgi:lambda family phage minor tail protein L